MFYPIQIESCPGFGWVGGPEFQTNVQRLGSGREKRNADWAICRHRYTAPYKNVTDEAYRAIKKVFMICRGKTHTFLHKDWADFQAVDEPFGVGDGTTKDFQLRKVSSDGGGTYTRTIDKPAAGVVIKVNGVVTLATVSELDGSVSFASAPANTAVLTWTGEFFVHVRFDTDALPFSLDNVGHKGFFMNGSIDLVEVLGE